MTLYKTAVRQPRCFQLVRVRHTESLQQTSWNGTYKLRFQLVRVRHTESLGWDLGSGLVITKFPTSPC